MPTISNADPIGNSPVLPYGLKTALALSTTLGWAVFPINPETGLAFRNESVAAVLGIPTPAQGDGGFHLARSDEASVRAMFTQWPDAQIGIATGAASGLYVLDIDRKNGKDGFATINRNSLMLGNTFWTNTKSGGRHYFYTVPRDGATRYKSEAGALGAGIDRKGDGGLVRYYGGAFGCADGVPMAPPPEWMLWDAGGHDSKRSPLGDANLSAPSLNSVRYALSLVDPNDLGFDQWIAMLAAAKQAAWNHGTKDDIEGLLLEWCARYHKNDERDSRYQINQIQQTALGWRSMLKRVPALQASVLFGDNPATMPIPDQSRCPSEPSEFFVRIADMVAHPPVFLIDELVETDSLAIVFGEPASGKSLIAIDMAASVATGYPFHDHAVLSGPVFYIAGEGKNGLRRRFAAWEQLTGQSINDAPIYASQAAVRLLDGASAAMVAASIEKLALNCGNPRMIVVDTLARNFGDGDENSQKDMNAFIAALDQLRERFIGSTVLLVHHSGHGDKERARGSSALRGAVDAEYKVAKDGDAVLLTNHKMKDAAPPSPMAFALVSAAGSVALEYIGEPTAKGGKRTAVQAMMLSAFDDAATDGKATIDAWRIAFLARREGSDSAKVRAFNRGKAWTIEARILTSDDGVVYERSPMPGDGVNKL